MNEEEAKETLKTMKENIDKKYLKTRNSSAIETVLNLIQTQQAEIEKKDKIIDEMSENIEKAIEYMEHYIKAEPNNENVKCEFREVIEILKGKSKEI